MPTVLGSIKWWQRQQITFGIRLCYRIVWCYAEILLRCVSVNSRYTFPKYIESKQSHFSVSPSQSTHVLYIPLSGFTTNSTNNSSLFSPANPPSAGQENRIWTQSNIIFDQFKVLCCIINSFVDRQKFMEEAFHKNYETRQWDKLRINTAVHKLIEGEKKWVALRCKWLSCVFRGRWIRKNVMSTVPYSSELVNYSLRSRDRLQI